jgi:hypothetical protein
VAAFPTGPPFVARCVTDRRITVAAQQPGVSYRVVHVGEVGRRDAGVFRRAYSGAEVEALRTRPEDEVVYEDGDTTFKEVLDNPSSGKGSAWRPESSGWA